LFIHEKTTAYLLILRVRPHYARFVVIHVLFVKKKSLANWHQLTNI